MPYNKNKDENESLAVKWAEPQLFKNEMPLGNYEYEYDFDYDYEYGFDYGYDFHYDYEYEFDYK